MSRFFMVHCVIKNSVWYPRIQVDEIIFAVLYMLWTMGLALCYKMAAILHILYTYTFLSAASSK